MSQINGVELENFTEWLGSQGAVFKELTNPYEVIRFKLGKLTHVLYRKSKGSFTVSSAIADLADLCRAGGCIEAAAANTRTSKQAAAPAATNRNEKSHGTTGPRHVPHCGCDALPWVACMHSPSERSPFPSIRGAMRYAQGAEA